METEKRSVNIRKEDDCDPNLTLFVENLPDNVSVIKLRNLFNSFGVIKNVFIAKKRSRSQKIFGFVKFAKSEDARNAVQGLQGRSIQGSCISLNVAKYNRQGKPYDSLKDRSLGRNTNDVERNSVAFDDRKLKRNENFKRPGVTFKDALLLDTDRKLKEKEASVHRDDEGYCLGSLNQTCIAWLRCSVVVITRKEETIISVQDNLQILKIHFLKVRKVESRIFLITFANSDQLWTLESSRWIAFNSWCFKCFKWFPELSMHLHVARVAIRGLPWQAWSYESAANVLQCQGEVLEIETDINKVDDLKEMIVTVLSVDNLKIFGEFRCKLEHGTVLVSVEELDYYYREESCQSQPVEEQSPQASQSVWRKTESIEKREERLALFPKAAAHFPNNLQGDEAGGNNFQKGDSSKKVVAEEAYTNQVDASHFRKETSEGTSGSKKVTKGCIGPDMSAPPGFDFQAQSSKKPLLFSGSSLIIRSKDRSAKRISNEGVKSALKRKKPVRRKRSFRSSSSFSSFFLGSSSKKSCLRRKKFTDFELVGSNQELVPESLASVANEDSNRTKSLDSGYFHKGGSDSAFVHPGLKSESLEKAKEIWKVGVQLGLRSMDEAKLLEKIAASVEEIKKY
ncbi:hypothetical protein REPUB_Repub02eG0269700 [Reevesia pubescens]